MCKKFGQLCNFGGLTEAAAVEQSTLKNARLKQFRGAAEIQFGTTVYFLPFFADLVVLLGVFTSAWIFKRNSPILLSLNSPIAEKKKALIFIHLQSEFWSVICFPLSSKVSYWPSFGMYPNRWWPATINTLLGQQLEFSAAVIEVFLMSPQSWNIPEFCGKKQSAFEEQQV